MTEKIIIKKGNKADEKQPLRIIKLFSIRAAAPVLTFENRNSSLFYTININPADSEEEGFLH